MKPTISQPEKFSISKFRCAEKKPIHIFLEYEGGGAEIVTHELVGTVNYLINKASNTPATFKNCELDVEKGGELLNEQFPMLGSMGDPRELIKAISESLDDLIIVKEGL